MIYTERKKLSVIELKEERNKIFFDEIEKLLWTKTSNMIYVEVNERLYGIISMGDVIRSVRNRATYVEINRRFTSVTKQDYMRAKEIFYDKSVINALPVVSEEGRLIGAYSRWDDLLRLEYIKGFNNNKFILDFLKKNKHIALVKPSTMFENKQRVFLRWKKMLEEQEVSLTVIEKTEIEKVSEREDYILFVDEDELRGTGVLFENILKKEFNWSRNLTYCKLFEKAMEGIVETEFLEEIQKSGVRILTLQYEESQSEYFKKFNSDIQEKFAAKGEEPGNKVFSEWRKDFFGELFSEKYAEDILDIMKNQVEIQNMDGVCKLKDTHTTYYNVTKGERLTTDQPKEYIQTIYFYGPCIAVGVNVEDKYTVESWLQRMLNNAGYKIRVCNLGCWGDDISLCNRIAETELRENDIIVLYMGNKKIENIPTLNLASAFEMNNVQATWVTNKPFHGNHKVNEFLANAICEKLKEDFIRNDAIGMQKLKKKDVLITKRYMNRYFADFVLERDKKMGAIVMNCNPFTYGHRYLIEKSLDMVDVLIIFVVEEDRSIFSFSERFAMVNEGTKDLKNVIIVPSGQYILSQTTFPEYFLKIADETLIHNVEYDVSVFAEQIAPKLNISYRFVGEEPEDGVTNEYNNAMKKILPSKGIELIEIPRKRLGEKVISASKVRKMLAHNNEDVDLYIPSSTKSILEYKNA